LAVLACVALLCQAPYSSLFLSKFQSSIIPDFCRRCAQLTLSFDSLNGKSLARNGNFNGIYPATDFSESQRISCSKD
jgi:hypothetical protein